MEYFFMIPSIPCHIGSPSSGRPSTTKRLWNTSYQEKLNAQIHLSHQFPHKDPFDELISLDITFYLPIPNTKKAQDAGKVHGNYHFTRPDLCNMIMFVESVCQGVIFADDSRVASIEARKVYDDNPRTEFKVTLLGRIEDESKKE